MMTYRSNVLFPAPRNPVRMVSGTRSCDLSTDIFVSVAFTLQKDQT